MASLQLDPLSNRYRIRFYVGEQECKRSFKTKDEDTAKVILGCVEETIRLLDQGRIEIPAGVDPGRFILNDGKVPPKIVTQKSMTLAELFASYQAALPEGAKEANTLIT